MKRSGSCVPRMAATLSLLVVYLTSTEALKVHGESSDMLMTGMEGVSHVADAAYEQQLISPNTWKALNNVTSFLEAAHSAGLDWTHSDAQRHIVSTANGLKKSMVSLSQSKLSKQGTFWPTISWSSMTSPKLPSKFKIAPILVTPRCCLPWFVPMRNRSPSAQRTSYIDSCDITDSINAVYQEHRLDSRPSRVSTGQTKDILAQ